MIEKTWEDENLNPVTCCNCAPIYFRCNSEGLLEGLCSSNPPPEWFSSNTVIEKKQGKKD